MANMLDGILEYFSRTSPQKIEQDFKELEYLNEIGPTIDEFIEFGLNPILNTCGSSNLEEITFSYNNPEYSLDYFF